MGIHGEVRRPAAGDLLDYQAGGDRSAFGARAGWRPAAVAGWLVNRRQDPWISLGASRSNGACGGLNMKRQTPNSKHQMERLSATGYYFCSIASGGASPFEL